MIQVTNLTKYFGGKRALGPASFAIEKGETVGFLGLNGAGKTTTLRILACDLRPSVGVISAFGIDALVDPHEVRKRIGFLPETPPLYQDMSVAAFLELAADLRGVARAKPARLVGEAIEVTDLGEVVHDSIATLSHGFRQRVGVAQAVEYFVLSERTHVPGALDADAAARVVPDIATNLAE